MMTYCNGDMLMCWSARAVPVMVRWRHSAVLVKMVAPMATVKMAMLYSTCWHGGGDGGGDADGGNGCGGEDGGNNDMAMAMVMAVCLHAMM